MAAIGIDIEKADDSNVDDCFEFEQESLTSSTTGSFIDSPGRDDGLRHRLVSFGGSASYGINTFGDCESLPEEEGSICGHGDYLITRLDVYCSGSLNVTGTGTPSIVRLKGGVIQWSSLPRSKRNSPAFTELQAETLLESPSSLPLNLVITSRIRIKTSKHGKEEVIGFSVLGAQASKVGRHGGPLLTALCLHFTKAPVEVYQEWVSTINHSLHSAGKRPQKLLFFINPMAGKGDAAMIYQQSVRPFLKVAEVEADVMLLNGPGSMRKYLSDPTRDVQQYDGIVAVGGDGTINELINISIFRAIESQVASRWPVSEASEEAEVPEHEFSIDQLRYSQSRIGVIPAGSINHIASSVFGSDSPAVATIHTLLGGRYLMDVCSLSRQRRLLTFGTTAVFSSPHHWAKSPKGAKRKLLRLSSSQQLNGPKMDKEGGEFFTSLRYQTTHTEQPKKDKLLETWATADGDEPMPTVSQMEIVHSDKSLTSHRWSTAMGSYGYLCIFATPYRDAENPSASSQHGLMDLVLTDSLARKDLFKSALKKKFVTEAHPTTAVLCHAQQAFINISIPTSPPESKTQKVAAPRKPSVVVDPLDTPPCRRSSVASVGSIGTIYSSIEVDMDVTIGHLKRISWSSIQGLAGEPQYASSKPAAPSGFTWFIDGDPIAATSLHVCILPKIVNFLALPLNHFSANT